MEKLRINDFFCGCGGMGVAFQNAGYEVVGAWDFDKYAVQTYRENVGNHVKQQDIKQLHWNEVPQAEVWAFGFPCQDLSNAGKGAGLVLECQDCHHTFEIDPETYTGNTDCPECGSSNTKAHSRSGCFFEIMRLLEETRENAPENLPMVILAENVKALSKYIPVLEEEYKKQGYEAHAQLFNSKWWGVAQNRERYAVVGTRIDAGLSFSFPEEQHEHCPKLSEFLDKGVDEKYYIPDEKAKTIIAQALEKLETLGKVHACITPERLKKRQNGPRAKAEEEPMFTLTAQDLHGVIIREDENADLGGIYEEKRYGEDAPLFPIAEGTKAGVAVARYGDSINISYPTSTTRRGRVGEEIAQTLLTECHQVVICDRPPGMPTPMTVAVLDKGRNLTMSEAKCEMVGMLDIKALDCVKRVYSPDGIEPTLTASQGGQRQVKIFDFEKYRVRKLTPTEYGRLQAFPMENWSQVVSDSQAYKQFGNAVTTTLFSAIAEQIKISIMDAKGEKR